jgi:hypothetical protein
MPLEAAAVADVLETVIRTALAPLNARVKALEYYNYPEMIGALRERLAALEAQPLIPGPPGENGADGAPGADGLGFDDYEVIYDGERTFTHRWTRGDRVVEKSFAVPMPLYRGVFVEGRIYERGDVVTVRGSMYVCLEDTTGRPASESKAWTLSVKSGQDSRGR